MVPGAHSVTRQLAEWVTQVRYDDIPEIGVHRVKERILDSFDVQLAGMETSPGARLSRWVRAQAAAPVATVLGAGFRTSPSLAALANASAGHALEYDDVAGQGGHPANPLTAGSLAISERLGLPGRDVIVAWMVGWEVTARTNRLTQQGARNTLLSKGWFPQGFQHALGVAAASAKLLGLDDEQTQMAIGNAASAMGGQMKHRASDTKSFIAGNAAMHGVMAAELANEGFTANPDILDGDDGIGALLGDGIGEATRVLDGLGEWDLVANRGTIKMFASCAAGHNAQEAVRRVRERRPFRHDEVESIVVALPELLMDSLPFHSPKTGLEGKYSIEYDVVAVALDGRAGIAQYTDAAVGRPEAQALMDRVEFVATPIDMDRPSLATSVVVTFTDGSEIAQEAADFHGSAQNPPTMDDLHAKFVECSPHLPAERREAILERCWNLDELDTVQELTSLFTQPTAGLDPE
jgi:2-methylcitrate dehydratase PrpD